MPTVPIEAIAFAVVNILVAFFTKALDGGVIKVGEEFYEMIKRGIEKLASARSALKELENNPRNANAQGSLRTQLERILQKDDELRTKLYERLISFFDINRDRQLVKLIAGEHAAQFGVVTDSQLNTNNEQFNAVTTIGKGSRISGSVETVINYNQTSEKKRKK